MAERVIFKRALGLNNKDNPASLSVDTRNNIPSHSSTAMYLPVAVNVDITDNGKVERRCGYISVLGDLSNAHSLCAFNDDWLLFADGSTLYAYNLLNDQLKTLFSVLTPDKVVSYTCVGNMIMFSNGIESGLIAEDGTSLVATDIPEYAGNSGDEMYEIGEMPVTNIVHYYKGSLYAANKDTPFMYCSEPYNPFVYNKVKGNIVLPRGIRFISNTDNALIVGTSRGLYAYSGNGLSDFREEVLTGSSCIMCSKLSSFATNNAGVTDIKKGVAVLTDEGILLVDNSLGITSVSETVDMDFKSIVNGSLAIVDNQIILSGELE